MRIGGALIVIALGAILKFAITVKDDHGFNLGTIGVILMVAGAIWLIAELVYSFSRRRTDVVHSTPVGDTRTTYVEPPAEYR